MEYCAKENLDITGLADADLNSIAHSYLAGFNPTQEKINMILNIKRGKLTLQEAVKETINKFKNT